MVHGALNLKLSVWGFRVVESETETPKLEPCEQVESSFCKASALSGLGVGAPSPESVRVVVAFRRGPAGDLQSQP